MFSKLGNISNLLATYSLYMKTKYIALLVSILGSSLSLGATISGLTSAYTKGSTTYDGSNGDTLTVSSPTSLPVATTGNWTIAFTVSNLAVTSDSNVGILFTYNTSKPYTNLEGMGYQLTASGDLSLCVGGFNYNGGTAASSTWKTQTLSGYSSDQDLTIFYTFSGGNVTISTILGNDTATLASLDNLASGAAFSGENMTQLNLSAKDTSGDTWTVPDGVTGQYTLENLDVYSAILTEDQMKEYAVGVVPEPATATLSLLGLGALLVRRRRA